jgi:hypothetical protein
MMKKMFIGLISLQLCAVAVFAATTVNSTHEYAYGANTGWINACGDGAHGAVIGRDYCSGYIYSANCGWISLGAGTPANGYAYGNAAANDYGINHDGLGNLSGYAYGANIGWVNFEQTHGKPKVDLETGRLSGSVWSANTGWISLSNAQAFVQTDSLDAGPDSDGDSIADAWEYRKTGNLSELSASGDADDDGSPDIDEYLAGTNPQDGNDKLMITDIEASGTTNSVTWTAKTTRRYTLMTADALTTNTVWTAAGTPFIPPSEPQVTVTLTGISATNRFYAIKAELPLE